MASMDNITEMVGRLVKGVPAEQAWLFGSHARGQAGPDSDVDILLVVDDSSEPRYKRIQAARKMVMDIPVPKDIIVMTRREWNAEVGSPASLAGSVLREGRRLYG
jgi:predicted nucleotidyltransferase